MRKNREYIAIAGAIIFSSLLISTTIIYTNIKPPFYHCYHNTYKAALAVGEEKYKNKPFEYIEIYAVDEAISHCSIINS